MKITVEDHHEPAGQTAVSAGLDGSDSGPVQTASPGPVVGPVQTAIEAFCTVDRAMASALRALSVAEPQGGLPADRLVGLAANVAGWDVAFCARAVDCLSVMPLTWTAFDNGVVSWSQIRGIINSAKTLCQADRATLDSLLTGAVDQNHSGEPERIVDIAEDLAGRLDDRRKAEREAATADRSFIRFQAHPGMVVLTSTATAMMTRSHPDRSPGRRRRHPPDR